jgi:hypothetical protein
MTWSLVENDMTVGTYLAGLGSNASELWPNLGDDG